MMIRVGRTVERHVKDTAIPHDVERSLPGSRGISRLRRRGRGASRSPPSFSRRFQRSLGPASRTQRTVRSPTYRSSMPMASEGRAGALASAHVPAGRQGEATPRTRVDRVKRIPPALQDLGALLTLSSGFLAAALVPRQYDKRVVKRVISGVLVRNNGCGGSRSGCASCCSRCCPVPISTSSPVSTAGCSARISGCDGARCTGPRASDDPVVGLPYLRIGASTERGVILWGDVVLRNARREDGPPSGRRAARAPEHRPPRGGVAADTVGLNLVAPIFTAAETPYLVERVDIPADQSLGYMRVLVNRLATNASCR